MNTTDPAVASDAEKLELICTVDNLQTTGWVLRRNLSHSERMARAGKIMGIFFGVAFLTVFIPILHFILPPISLIVGGVLSFNEYSNHGEMLEGEFTCPNCKKVQPLPHEGEEWPRIQRCSGCSFTLTLNPKTGPSTLG